ncbi:CaiB/BaiF CoA-transferase family protein [Oryzomicrobium sp.]|uniref:CaiB/BaiF CoA transferase family protein n=1 Tax=Oryzomicrobium sp. TaxID=1911578 RepID=UPI0025FE3C86|nr:CaiB/BaiF CoA-transferase family protein [Oryzomicrobium sp.]MCE1243138.1 CoA transferase [Oryzomicrobium sp.]
MTRPSSPTSSAAAPLHGVRVLDLTRLLPGPLATRHLADLGAEIIKIEDTGAGDYAREMGPPPPGLRDSDSRFFRALNRGKRALRLDLKHPLGKAVLRRLAESADVLVESFRPGVMDRLGLGYEALKAVNPRLVYCAITGYGQDGPWRDLAGHDLNYLAVSGVLERTASTGAVQPAIPSLQIGDLLGGALPAALSIVAALYGARQSGQGRMLDVAMAEVVLTHHMTPLLAEAGAAAPRGEEMLTGGLPWYGVYATQDGRHLAVGALEAKFWAAFCATVERPEWAGQQHLDGAERDALRAAVADLIASRPLAHWAERFATVDACVTPVLTPEEALHLPQFQARGLAGDELRSGAAASPFVMDGVRLTAGGEPPAPGQDSRAILLDAGFAMDEVDGLLAQGIL